MSPTSILPLLSAYLWLSVTSLLAQEEKTAPPKDEPPAPDVAAPAGPFTPAEWGAFERMRGIQLSADGRWLAASISRVDGASEVRLVSLATGTEEVLDEAASPQFSPDGGFFVWREAKDPDPTGAEKPDQPARSRYHVRDLVAGSEADAWEGVASVSWDDSGKFALLRRTGDDDAIVVQRMADGRQWAFARVASHAWADNRPLLAMVCHHEDRLGNSVQVLDPSAGTLRVLHSAAVEYHGLSWRKDHPDVAVLAATEHEDCDDAVEALAWTGVHREPEFFAWSPNDGVVDPEGLSLVVDGGIEWADAGDRLFLGLRPWRHAPPVERRDDSEDQEKDADEKDDVDGPAGQPATQPATGSTPDAQPGKPQPGKPEPSKPEGAKPGRALRESLKDPAGVEIWHAKDIDILPRQKRRLAFERRRTTRAVWWPAEDEVVLLGDEPTESVQILARGKVALGLDNTPYEEEKRFGPTRRDVYRIDQRTGEKQKVLEGVKILRDTGPKGRHLLVHQHGALRSVDLRSGTVIDLTSGLQGDFVADEGNTLTDEHGGFGVAGWSENGRWVFVHSRYDLWRLSPDGRKAECLTAGRETQMRHRLVELDEEAEFVPADGPWLVQLYGDRSKESGYGVVRPNRAIERLRQDAAHISSLTKSRDAEVYAWSEERFDRSTEVWTAGKGLAKPVARIHTNQALLEGRPWGRAELVDYENTRGEALQGALFYPAGFEPGRRYPMVTYIYELRSQYLHRFVTPSELEPYNTAVFTQAGYFVFQPDITYRAQNPGLSAAESVLPAVRAVLARGEVDPERVGLVGHSWGAYQTAFLATQTDVFAACVAGAPLTNMMSMSMSIYWNSGQTDAWIFHESQGRMDKPFWQDVDTYIANSPIFHVDRMKTPLLVAFGDDDGAVDFNQGVELYNAARLVQAPMVMLVYPGENHSLRQRPNRVDYHWRVREWFDHYLKGEPAPRWITDGQPWLERTRELEDRKRNRAKAPAKK